MLTLNDGRSELWQWDTGRTLSVDADCSQVHFSNNVFGRSIDVNVVDGVAIIPDVLLQSDKDLNVWAFVGTAENGYTKISKTFKVNRRNKPADYVFTQTDQITLQTIQSQIGNLADLTTEAKDTLVAAINEAARTGGGGGSTVELDTTLTQSGKAADAKAVGDALAGKQDTISDIATIRSGAAKGATALQTVPSTYRTAFAQDVIDSGLGDRIEVIEGKEAGWDAKSDFSGSYNDLTDKPTIPTALPNPNALTFTGAVTGTYDGSAAVSVEIPAGGGGSGDITDVLMDVTIEEAVAAVTVTLDTPRAYKELYIATCVYGDESNSSANAMFLRVNNTGVIGDTNAIAYIPDIENAKSATAKSYGVAFVKLLDDCSFYYCYGSKAANARTPQSSYGEKYTVFNKETIISTLKFQSINQWTKFGVGSTIKVYGVRS